MKPPQATPGKRAQKIIELLGMATSSGPAALVMQRQYGIPAHVLQAANHHGIWDVTALLPYLENAG